MKHYTFEYQCAISDFLLSLPSDFPICFLGGDSDISILATSFSPATIDEVFAQDFQTKCINHQSFSHGYVGVLSYDLLQSYANEKTLKGDAQCFFVHASLTFHRKTNSIEYISDDHSGHWHIDLEEIKKLLSNIQQHIIHKFEVTLIPKTHDFEHELLVNQAISQIKSGRFYQINLLRFFEVQGLITRHNLIQRLCEFGGPYSCLFDFEQFKLASFSPEKFVNITNNTITTNPIKGTRARSENHIYDNKLKEELQHSAKDNAELHMIVDLMRNDLNRICVPGSVEVLSPGKVYSFKNIHHLIAEIEGSLKERITLGQLLQNISPGGSITGAPKKEVMKAIEEFEQRKRNYFMGHAFYFDIETKNFHSSILIRTLTSLNGKHFEYAAGSGIVINSNAQSEVAEVYHKCKVISQQ